jgi:hypothetical protein
LDQSASFNVRAAARSTRTLDGTQAPSMSSLSQKDEYIRALVQLLRTRLGFGSFTVNALGVTIHLHHRDRRSR